MTEKLYDKDAYETEFTARVVSIEKSEKETLVELDRTLFFPEEGGQSPDRGLLAGYEVRDVQIKKGIILHTLPAEAMLSVGDCVNGSIDWEHRFSNMQQHSGEHIFSGLVHWQYGYNNVGFHLSDSIVTMDYDGVLSPEQVAELEEKANRAVLSNLTVKAYYPQPKELEQLEYRSKLDLKENVRIVEIPGIDVCACCAPHVHSTGEIGIIKIMSLENYKGGVRLSLLCGKRARLAMAEKIACIDQLKTSLKAPENELTEAVAKLQKTNQQLKQELRELNGKLLSMQIKGVPADARDLILITESEDVKAIRDAVNRLTSEHAGIVAVVSYKNGKGLYIIGSSGQDVRPLGEKLRSIGGKGGGTAQMIQGSVEADLEQIRDCLAIEEMI